MSNASEPKILIISESFSAGSAITGINLFQSGVKIIYYVRVLQSMNLLQF